MKLGISSYCLFPAMEAGEMTIYDVIDYAKNLGCEHIEFVPFALPFVIEEKGRLDEALIDGVREKCADVGLEISTFSVNADVLKEDPEELAREIERVKLYIDAAERLGLKRMRHDIASFRRPFFTNTSHNFERELPMMVEGSRILYDYAAQRGIYMTIENHGFFCNGSDRVLRLLEAIDRPELKLTMDVGNFLCVDEYPHGAVQKCAPFAEIIHFKDFYIRDKDKLPGQAEMFNCDNGSWFETMGGKMLRGSITGQGDIDLWSIARHIKASGFDGYISIEFEGMEPCRRATEISYNMVKCMLGEAGYAV